MDTQVTATNVGGKLTLSIIISCIVAASSGLLFGYDIGISGSFFFIMTNELCNLVIFLNVINLTFELR
jgi:hypothetical protein